MAWADDFSIDAALNIRHVSGTTRYTGLEMHRAIGVLAAQAEGSGDDLMDISVLTASDKATGTVFDLLNGANIDDLAATFLYDCSITQLNGDERYSGLVIVGGVVGGAGSGNTEIIIIQDNALLTDTWSASPNPDATKGIILRTLVKSRENGVDIDGARILIKAAEFGDGYAEFAVLLGEGNATGALVTAADGNNQTAQGTVAGWAITNTEGYQLLDVSAAGSQEPFYSQWDLGIQSLNDLFEFGKNIQRRGSAETIHGMNGQLFRGPTHEIDYDTEAGTGPATNDELAWGLRVIYDNLAGGSFAVGDPVSIGGLTTKGRILSIDVTNLTLVIDIELDGTPIDNDQIAVIGGGVTADVAGAPVGQAIGGGVGILLAVLDSGTTGTVWPQLIKGSAPADGAIMYETGDTNSGNTITVNIVVTPRTISSPFIGVSTGSAINPGAYGLGIDPTDLASTSKLVDLGENDVSPPNNTTFATTGWVAGEDQVLVGPRVAGILELDQDTINGALTTGAVTSVVVTTAIPTDTKASGTIRIQTDAGFFIRVPYDSFVGSTYTIPSFDFTGVNNCASGNNVYISYIDKLATSSTESYTSVYSGTDRDLFVRGRDGGVAGDLIPIKTIENAGTMTSTGGAVAVNRISDA